VGASYPPWYDPSYWNAGLRARFELKPQLRAIATNALPLYDLLYPPLGGLIAAVLVLFRMGGTGWSRWRATAAHWYLLVVVQARYIAPFALLFWAAMLPGVSLPDSPMSRRLITTATVAAIATLAVSMIGTAACQRMKGCYGSAHPQWEVAEGLRQMGVRPGDKVASIGLPAVAYWARLGRVSVVAEIPEVAADTFWLADPSVQSQVIETIAKTGAKLIVADKVPPFVSPAGWRRIGKTDRYAYFLREDPQGLKAASAGRKGSQGGAG
jgi:hypothetical protein